MIEFIHTLIRPIYDISVNDRQDEKSKKFVFSASFINTMALSRIKKLLAIPTCVFFILCGYYASNCAIYKCFEEDSEHLLSSNSYRFGRTPSSREYWRNHLARYQSNPQLS